MKTTDPLAPGGEQWLRTITASKIPAILGVSRYQSQYALWHTMAGNLAPNKIDESTQERFDYGHACESAASEFWRYRNPGWRLSRDEVRYSREELPFPNLATLDRRASRGSSRRVVEVKTARSLEEWGDDGSGIVPADYAAQVIWQQHLTGWHDPADLVLWPVYGYPRVYHVEYDADLAALFVAKATAWHESLAAGTPPELDDSVSCYEAVRRLHPDIDDDAVQLDPDLAADYLTATSEAKAIESRLRECKTRVLDAMGRAKTAQCNGQKVADRRPARGGAVSLYANTKANLDALKELTLV